MMNNILCVIVLYKPTIENVAQIVESIKPYVREFYLWDNTPHGEIQQLFGINVHRDLKEANIGLSGAYNNAVGYAASKGFDYLMTMDQDSQWSNFRNYIYLVFNREKEVGAFHTIYFASTILNNVDYTTITSGGINSGAIIPLKFLKSINGYTSDFFIDAIDDWLQVKALQQGIQCVLIGNSQLIQKFGSPMIHYVLGKRIEALNYSPSRLYSILRNYIKLWREYHIPKELKQKIVNLFIVRYSIVILLVEKCKYKKLKAMLYGFFDGLLNRKYRRDKFIGGG